jgi:putative endonuclease
VNSGERRAARHYRLRGWRVVDANVRVGRDELDLILRRGRRLLFVEVKEKRGDGFGLPLEMIDGRKFEHVARASQRWLSAHPETRGLAVDLEAVGVSPGRIDRVRLELDGR